MKRVIIAAHDPDLVIGKEGALPWHYPEDLKHFKARTLGHPILMGRRVFEEIGCKPLPKRRNVVISSTSFENVEVYSSVASAFEALSEEPVVYIIGGAKLYQAVLPVADRLEITLVHNRHSGDVFFPEYRDQLGSIWKESSRREGEGITFVDYDRVCY
jgi:dihydrofolate reductase